MLREAVILLMFAAGASLLYLGLEKSLPALAGFLRVPRRPSARAAAPPNQRLVDLVRAVLIGLCLLLLGALSIYGAVARLNQP